MSLDLPDSADDVIQRSKTDVQRELEDSNPFLKNSWLSALVIANGNRIFDFYIQLQEAINLNFPDTTSGEFLDRWAAIWGVPRTPATQSVGDVVATGVSSAVIPVGTDYQSSDGLTYNVTATATIATRQIPLVNIVRVGDIAVVTFSEDHDIASNVLLTIAGADQPEYNGQKTITVTGSDTVEYPVTGSPDSPATGTITATVTSALVPVRSSDFGADTNQVLDSVLVIQTPLLSVDNTANVSFGEIGGGVDQESDEALLVRMLDRIQNPVAHFSISDIDAKAKTVPGVTRVFVQPVTPSIGQVTIYFMRDGDSDPIPTQSEVDTVKETLIEILPANTGEVDLIVDAPTPKIIPYTFTNIVPDTATMQTAIENSLAQFFEEQTLVGIDIDEDAYRSAIFSTVDTASGDTLQTFTLSNPIGDVAINISEIGILGMVTFT